MSDIWVRAAKWSFTREPVLAMKTVVRNRPVVSMQADTCWIAWCLAPELV
ncbi:MAG: hypothetical protein ABSD97_17140 [Acidimicrobiales bacterium]